MFTLPPQFKNITTLEKNLIIKSEAWWIKRGERMALKLFHQMAVRVPAYKKFLRSHSIRPSSIKKIVDLKKVPHTDKENYLKKNRLPDLCWDGKLAESQWTFSTTSGSTGKPFYFPRQSLQNSQYSIIAELYLRQNFQIHNKTTLYIDAFAMGAWIGGLFTFQALERLSERGKYSISIITPGNDIDEIIKAVKKIGKFYKQIIIGGYPPFIKMLIDEGWKKRINWKKYRLGFIFSAEAFSESFRDYIIKFAQLDNSLMSTLNHYGTADFGTMAYETPLSIFIRRQTLIHKKLKESFFGIKNDLPTLCQYIPELFYFEEEHNNLFCSGYSGLPLMKYNLKDYGGIISMEEAVKKITDQGIHFWEIVRKIKLRRQIWHLPFVYVSERTDFTVSLYGANIYAGNIRKALNYEKISKKITGRFSMHVQNNNQYEPYLEIIVELQSNVRGEKKLSKKVQESIINELLQDNSEYEDVYKYMGKKAYPKIKLTSFGDPSYFNHKIKQRWVI